MRGSVKEGNLSLVLGELIRELSAYIAVYRRGLFDQQYYLRSNPDLVNKVSSPFLHYMRHGWREGRNPSAFFDTDFYNKRYNPKCNPLIDLLNCGEIRFTRPFPELGSSKASEFKKRVFLVSEFTHEIIEAINKLDSEATVLEMDLADIFTKQSSLSDFDVAFVLRSAEHLKPLFYSYEQAFIQGIALLGVEGSFDRGTSSGRILEWIEGESASISLAGGSYCLNLHVFQPLLDSQIYRSIWYPEGFSSKDLGFEGQLLSICSRFGLEYKEIDRGKIKGNLPFHYRFLLSDEIKMSLAAIVLNYNCVEDTMRCIERLRGQVDKIFVVDNSSQVEQRSDFALIRSENNLGYAGGNNLGIKAALSEGFTHLLVINPDAAIENVSLMMQHFRFNSDLGVVSPAIYLDDSKSTLWYGGMRINPYNGLPEHIGMGENVTRLRRKEIEAFTGCAFIVSAKCLATVGLLPEEYFLYFEDVDFSKTISRYGWRILFEPGCSVIHRKRSTATDTYVYYFLRNRIHFVKKWYPELFQNFLESQDEFISAHRVMRDEKSRFDEIVKRALCDGYKGVFGKYD